MALKDLSTHKRIEFHLSSMRFHAKMLDSIVKVDSDCPRALAAKIIAKRVFVETQFELQILDEHTENDCSKKVS